MTLYLSGITDRRFGRYHGLHLRGQAVYLNLITLKTKAVLSFETSRSNPPTTRRHIPQLHAVTYRNVGQYYDTPLHAETSGSTPSTRRHTPKRRAVLLRHSVTYWNVEQYSPNATPSHTGTSGSTPQTRRHIPKRRAVLRHAVTYWNVGQHSPDTPSHTEISEPYSATHVNLTRLRHCTLLHVTPTLSRVLPTILQDQNNSSLTFDEWRKQRDVCCLSATRR